MLNIRDFLKKRGTSIVKISFFAIILIFIVFSIKNDVESIDFAKTITLIRDFSIPSILLLTVLGIIAISSITIYDFLIIRYFGLDIKPITILNVSFIASTINNIAGLGGLTGASIRAVFFKKGDDNTDIFDYNLLLVPATAIGLGVLAILLPFNYKFVEPIINKYKILLLALLGFIIYLLIYFFIDIIFYKFKKNDKELLNKKRFLLKFNLLISSIFEWILAYLLFTIILRHFNRDINFVIILSIFTLGSIAGIISMLPGGVGSFDLIALAGFQSFGVLPEHVLATLILYRTFYYFIPLIAGIIFTLIAQAQDKTLSYKIFNTSKFKGFISRTSSLTNLLLSILVFTSGIVLLFSALIPGVAERIKFASKLLSFPILQWSKQLSISIGIILVTISRDIMMKVKRAYKITYWLLLLGAIFTFLKGFDYEEAAFLLLVLIVLWASKDSFYRKSVPFDWYQFILSALVALVGIIIYMRLSHIILIDFVKLNNFKYLFSKGISNFQPNGLIAYGSFIVYIVVKELTKERISSDNRYEEVDEDRVGKFLEENGGSYLSHLIFLKDKHLFWSKTNKVFFAFEKSHNIIVVLGDPIGDSNYFGEAIEEFHDFIDSYGFKSVFYEVSDKNLPLYHEHGYYFFKLGETALVDLETFDIASSKSRDFRNVLSRFKRDGYYFEMIDGSEISDNLYTQFISISNEWLRGRNEMGFSLGFLDRQYLEKGPISLVRKMDDEKIIAFASLMPKYGHKSISIDLMRFEKIVPSNTMTFLILNLMIYYKDNGYKTLNLGMAPLSNVGMTQNAHFRERIAHLVFKYGKELYSFGGLRQYKEKFSPKWESRYLAYEDLTLLPASIIEATILIHSKK